MDKGFACPSVVPVGKQNEDNSFRLSPLRFAPAFVWCHLQNIARICSAEEVSTPHRLTAAPQLLKPARPLHNSKAEPYNMADSSEVKIEYFWCDAIAPRQADAGQARPAVERTALVRGQAAVIHQHPANGLVIKALANL